MSLIDKLLGWEQIEKFPGWIKKRPNRIIKGRIFLYYEKANIQKIDNQGHGGEIQIGNSEYYRKLR